MISIIGFGSFGTSLAYIISKNTQVRIYTRDKDALAYYNEFQMNKKYLTSLKLNDNITVTTNIDDVINDNIEILVLAIPSTAIISFLESTKSLISMNTLIVNTAKGFCSENNCNLSKVIAKILPNNPIATIQGPSFAQEIVADHPTEVVIASTSLIHAKQLQRILTTKYFTTTLSSDVVGVEFAGALKNIYAIGAGLLEGKGYKSNTMSKYVTHCYLEQSKIIQAIGGHISEPNVATLGDLLLTCYGTLSRNKKFGISFAKGEKDLNPSSLEAGTSKTTVEGINSMNIAISIADKNNLDAPILRGINEVLKGNSSSLNNFI
jgi:glycerol-3-phosphate dehydrogenase (NAD(P)+)